MFSNFPLDFLDLPTDFLAFHNDFFDVPIDVLAFLVDVIDFRRSITRVVRSHNRNKFARVLCCSSIADYIFGHHTITPVIDHTCFWCGPKSNVEREAPRTCDRSRVFLPPAEPIARNDLLISRSTKTLVIDRRCVGLPVPRCFSGRAKNMCDRSHVRGASRSTLLFGPHQKHV